MSAPGTRRRFPAVRAGNATEPLASDASNPATTRRSSRFSAARWPHKRAEFTVVRIPMSSGPLRRPFSKVRAVVSEPVSLSSPVIGVRACTYLSRPDKARPSPEGRSKNASSGEAFFGWGEWCNNLNGAGSTRLPPPEKRAPLRFAAFFDLPSREMGTCVHARAP